METMYHQWLSIMMDKHHQILKLLKSQNPKTPSQTCTTLTKKCQASITVIQKTRRIQVSMTDKNCITVSKGVQCSSLFDGVSLREAARLVPLAEPKQEANQDILNEDTHSDD